MSEEISQDTKFRPGPNGGLKSDSMASPPDSAYIDATPEDVLDCIRGCYGLKNEDEAAAEFIRLYAEAKRYVALLAPAQQIAALEKQVQARDKRLEYYHEQIAALTEKLDSLKLAAAPEDTRYWGISNREAGEIVDDILLNEVVDEATKPLAGQVAALTAEAARLRDALFDISREHVDETRSTTPQLVQIAKDALSSPPADPSGLLALVRAVAVFRNNAFAVSEESGGFMGWDDCDLGSICQAYDALDPAIKAAAERSVK